MTLIVLFSTACAIFAGIAVVSGVIAARHCREASHSAARLQQTRGTVVALEGIVVALDGRLASLNGRVSALKRWGSHQADPDPGFDPALQEVPCPNWRTPTMPEGDDCKYCTAMRAERAAALAKLPVVGSRPRLS